MTSSHTRHKKDKPLLIGAHTSAAGGVYNALLEGKRIGADTIQLFTANQKQWKPKQPSPEDVAKWHETLAETGLQKIMSHAGYLINLGCPKEENLAKSRQAFHEEIVRCLDLKISYLNFHPGAALDGTEEQCLETIIESLLAYEKLLAKGPTRLLLEMTAGQGSTVGYTFEQMATIIRAVEKKIPIGICIDTCHIFAAGYDIRTKKAWNETLAALDSALGLKHLYAFHINDSLKPLASRRDRHANLGEGEIGLPCFEFLVTDPRTSHLPMYLETPNGDTRWPGEMELLRSMAAKSA